MAWPPAPTALVFGVEVNVGVYVLRFRLVSSIIIIIVKGMSLLPWCILLETSPHASILYFSDLPWVQGCMLVY